MKIALFALLLFFYQINIISSKTLFSLGANLHRRHFSEMPPCSINLVLLCCFVSLRCPRILVMWICLYFSSSLSKSIPHLVTVTYGDLCIPLW